MSNPNQAEPTEAAKILPGAVITEHPDHPHQPGEWIITKVRRISEDPLLDDRRLIRLDYLCPDGTGVFVLDADTNVTARRANTDWFEALSRLEQRRVIAYVSGYAPEALARAAAHVEDTRDYITTCLEQLAEVNAR